MASSKWLLDDNTIWAREVICMPKETPEREARKEVGFEGWFRGIPNDQLTEEDIPPPEASWMAIVDFASTWDAYIYWGSFEKCAEIANTWAKRYYEEGKLPETLEELRTCLFFEWRRWRHLGDPPPKEAMRYVWDLVEAIRRKVRERQQERRDKLP
jgi:hypothetical protein